MTKRESTLYQQLKISVIFKILNIFLSFLLIKYMILYLGNALYGVWVVIFSVVMFIINFDLGISNGIKNQLAYYLALNKIKRSKEVVTVGYMIAIIFSIVSFSFLLLCSDYVNWQNIFGIYILSNNELKKLILIMSFFILFNFILSIVFAVYNAVQRTSLIIISQFFSQTFSLIAIYFLMKIQLVSIFYLAYIYGGSLIVSNFFVSIFFYRKHKYLIPHYKYLNFKIMRPIFNLSIKFFVLQLTILFIFSTDRILISHFLGPENVTIYDVLYKYFSIVSVINNLINTPLWSMYTEAYTKKDYKWIIKILKKMIKLFFVYFVLIILQVNLGEKIIHLWLGKKIIFENSTIILSGTMVLMILWHSIFAYFTNGINKTMNQMLSTLLGAIINIPLTIYFVTYLDLGLNGVLLATICSLLIFNITGPIQAYYELKIKVNK